MMNGMVRTVHEMRLEMNGLVAADIVYRANNHNHAEITDHTAGGGCLFSGFALEAPEVYEREKARLQKIAEDFKAAGAELIIIK